MIIIWYSSNGLVVWVVYYKAPCQIKISQIYDKKRKKQFLIRNSNY